MRALSITHRDVTRHRLLNLANEVPGAWVGLKIAALLLVLDQQRPGWITKVLGLTRMSLTRWVHAVNRHGVHPVKPIPPPGRPPKLTATVRRVLATHLERSPQTLGLPRAQWDGLVLVEHVKRHFGIALHVRQAQRWLHQLGYRLKRAGYVYVQARAEDAKRFQRRLKKTPDVGAA